MEDREDKVIVTPPAANSVNGYTKFESWGGDSFHSRYIDIRARRVVRAGNDEAQIELAIHQTKRKQGARCISMHGGIVLSPDEARALALAICPELAPK